MGKEKGGFLTPKAIANRIKAKGLQKLRWFCQMCQKQCRDENGFKCHLTSESHQRQLLLFAENPDKYVDSFSQEFLDDFLELLRRKCGTKRVHCNIVYQDYISDRNHTHMNSTQWETLTDFVKWTGREGHCVVDQTEKGWFMQLIDRNPETIQKQDALQKKDKMDMDDEERSSKFIQKQIERANAESKEAAAAEYTALQRQNEDEKITLSLGLKRKAEAASTSGTAKKSATGDPFKTARKGPERAIQGAESTKGGSSLAGHKKKSALGDIMKFEEEKKEKKNRKEYWLHKDIVVKMVTKKLGEKYYKKKAVVKEVQGQYVGIIKLLDSGDKLKVDQAHVETVIPALGKTVMVVNGAYRGSEATLQSLDEKHFCCSVQLSQGALKGRVVEGVQYEDISKLHIPS